MHTSQFLIFQLKQIRTNLQLGGDNMRLTRGIIAVTIAALITSTSFIALASSADSYSEEVIQLQSAMVVLQSEQNKLQDEIENAQNNGDLTLATQKQAQYEQNNVMLNQLSALSIDADIERIKQEIADLEAESLQLRQQHSELTTQYTEAGADEALQSTLKMGISGINMKLMNIGMRIVNLQIQLRKIEIEKETEQQTPSMVSGI